MPNHILNKIFATDAVLDTLRGDDGAVDFCTVLPMPDGLFVGDISSLAEDCAQKAFNEPVDENPLLAMLQTENRKKWSAANLSDDGFEDFIAMCRSKRATGYYHGMDFCREVWGTKWNAYSIDRQPDHVSFQTAWAAPEPVFCALSLTHPEEEIRVDYADEDWGHNCATLVLRGGVVVKRQERDLAFSLDLWDVDAETRAEYAEAE